MRVEDTIWVESNVVRNVLRLVKDFVKISKTTLLKGEDKCVIVHKMRGGWDGGDCIKKSDVIKHLQEWLLIAVDVVRNINDDDTISYSVDSNENDLGMEINLESGDFRGKFVIAAIEHFATNKNLKTTK